MEQRIPEDEDIEEEEEEDKDEARTPIGKPAPPVSLRLEPCQTQLSRAQTRPKVRRKKMMRKMVVAGDETSRQRPKGPSTFSLVCQVTFTVSPVNERSCDRDTPGEEQSGERL